MNLVHIDSIHLSLDAHFLRCKEDIKACTAAEIDDRLALFVLSVCNRFALQDNPVRDSRKIEMSR